MPLGGAAIAGGAGLATGLIGMSQANARAAEAAKAKQNAVQQWLQLNVPDPAQQAIELQKYQSSGQLSPQLEQTFQQSQSGLQGMQIDPSSRAAEVNALTQMQQLASNGGMDAQAKQQEAQAINSANTNEQGQRGAIVQSFAQRGAGGAGAQLAAELQASQGDANNAAAGGLASAANGEQRALQAMTNSSNMASNLNNQDYTQAANAAKAQDAINQFNTQNAQHIAGANTSAQNQAQATNLQNAQNLSNANVGLTNQQEIHNKGLLEQQFQNEQGKASGAANAYGGVANQANADANRVGQEWGNIGQAISGAAGAYGQYANSQAKAPQATSGVQVADQARAGDAQYSDDYDPNKQDDELTA